MICSLICEGSSININTYPVGLIFCLDTQNLSWSLTFLDLIAIYLHSVLFVSVFFTQLCLSIMLQARREERREDEYEYEQMMRSNNLRWEKDRHDYDYDYDYDLRVEIFPTTGRPVGF